MTSYNAWHYDIEPPYDSPCRQPVAAGTHCGEGLETREQAIANIARQHGVSRERVKVRKAGVENF